jgi:hypothetical protein
MSSRRSQFCLPSWWDTDTFSTPMGCKEHWPRFDQIDACRIEVQYVTLAVTFGLQNDSVSLYRALERVGRTGGVSISDVYRCLRGLAMCPDFSDVQSLQCFLYLCEYYIKTVCT